MALILLVSQKEISNFLKHRRTRLRPSSFHNRKFQICFSLLITKCQDSLSSGCNPSSKSGAGANTINLQDKLKSFVSKAVLSQPCSDLPQVSNRLQAENFIVVEQPRDYAPTTTLSSLLLSAVILSLASPLKAVALPCASDYEEYRRRLIEQRWLPVEVANHTTEHKEVSTGSRIGTATWINPIRGQKIVLVLWWQKMKLCVSPQFSVSPQ